MATIAPALCWTQVPPAILDGEGLQPYRPGEIDALFDRAERPGAQSRHKIAYERQFLIDVVEHEANTVHQSHKPGDEIILVRDGALTLTTEATGEELRVAEGEAVLIPQGWAGLYRAQPRGRRFRALAIVPHDYFDPARRARPSGGAPEAITLHDGPGRREVHRGRYAVATEYLPGDCEWTVRAVRDEVTVVLAGQLTLTTEDERESFGPGSVVALPMGFRGAAEASGGYRALTAYWLG